MSKRRHRRARPASSEILYLRAEAAPAEIARDKPIETRPEPSTEPAKDASGVLAVRTTSAADTLQQSRERVASRWFALKGLVGEAGEGSEQRAQVESSALSVPMLAVVSLARFGRLETRESQSHPPFPNAWRGDPPPRPTRTSRRRTWMSIRTGRIHRWRDYTSNMTSVADRQCKGPTAHAQRKM